MQSKITKTCLLFLILCLTWAICGCTTNQKMESSEDWESTDTIETAESTTESTYNYYDDYTVETTISDDFSFYNLGGKTQWLQIDGYSMAGNYVYTDSSSPSGFVFENSFVTDVQYDENGSGINKRKETYSYSIVNDEQIYLSNSDTLSIEDYIYDGNFIIIKTNQYHYARSLNWDKWFTIYDNIDWSCSPEITEDENGYKIKRYYLN